MAEASLPHLVRAHRDRYESTRSLASGRLARIVRDHTGRGVDRRLVRALGEEELLEVCLPTGRRPSAVEICLVREALAYGCSPAENAFALQGLGGYPLMAWASAALKRAWLPQIAAGQAIAAFALTEPDAGSDAAALGTTADKDGEGWRLSGVKRWISNAPEADLYVVFARTGEAPGAGGITAFAVQGDAPGVSGRGIELLSPHPIGTVELDGVAVSDDARLGEAGRGFSVAMTTLDLFRPSVGAAAVGMGLAALGMATRHAAERKAFGGHLKDLQTVSHTLAEMDTRISAARLLVYEAAVDHDSHEPSTASAARAKAFATEAAQWVIDRALQIHGAAALERGHPLEQLYRDVRAMRIYEGATEVQREVIARALYR